MLIKSRRVAVQFGLLWQRSAVTVAQKMPKPFEFNGVIFRRDERSNAPRNVLACLDAKKHLLRHHPLSIVRQRIKKYCNANYRDECGEALFSSHNELSPILAVDDLVVPADNNVYYLNEQHLLRPDTTANQAMLIAQGLHSFMIGGDVYRRCAIDTAHFPVQHRADAVRLLTERQVGLPIFEQDCQSQTGQPAEAAAPRKQPCHTLEAMRFVEHEVKQLLENCTNHLFGNQVAHRWTDACFAYTYPSWKLEVVRADGWHEVSECGIIRHDILRRLGVHQSIGYTFGFSLERLAMLLFGIPDIRLFRSTHKQFLSQFNEPDLNEGNEKWQFLPIETHPTREHKLSFFLVEDGENNKEFDPKDLYDVARSVAWRAIEEISLIDVYRHPTLKATSHTYKVSYRHPDRAITKNQVLELHNKFRDACGKKLNVIIR